MFTRSIFSFLGGIQRLCRRHWLHSPTSTTGQSPFLGRKANKGTGIWRRDSRGKNLIVKVIKQHMLTVHILDKTENIKKTNTIFNTMLKCEMDFYCLSTQSLILTFPHCFRKPIFIFFWKFLFQHYGFHRNFHFAPHSYPPTNALQAADHWSRRSIWLELS